MATLTFSAENSHKIEPFDGRITTTRAPTKARGNEELTYSWGRAENFEELVFLKVNEQDYHDINSVHGQTYRVYAAAIRKLFGGAFPGSSDDQVVPYFVKGLRNCEVKIEMWNSECSSVWDCVDIAVKLINALNMELASVKPTIQKNALTVTRSDILQGNFCPEIASTGEPMETLIRIVAPLPFSLVSMIRYDIISDINDIKNKPIHCVLMANGLPCDVIGEIDLSLSLEDKNIIRPSKSAWSSPVVLANKKSDGIILCVDYRSLNNNLTTSDAIPVTRIDEILDRLHGEANFILTSEHDESLQSLKMALVSFSLDGLPKMTMKFIVDVDASDTDIGAVLSQINENDKEVVIQYASKMFTDVKRRYSTT
ncbi:hypothetical protein RF11_07150 [Thelohanellus kitauei]|uniref:Reverse transcriptase/retrotransposon-derived protein RNase H-like domain-containing protein n=1 Tax=Thelohanellus kitauei TaxID=669202 RepID=A0A0C2JYV6_THEKT|nr:hypothetical protein RF11_07150 [Thelohanellus kitauei]